MNDHIIDKREQRGEWCLMRETKHGLNFRHENKSHEIPPDSYRRIMCSQSCLTKGANYLTPKQMARPKDLSNSR